MSKTCGGIREDTQILACTTLEVSSPLLLALLFAAPMHNVINSGTFIFEPIIKKFFEHLHDYSI